MTVGTEEVVAAVVGVPWLETDATKAASDNKQKTVRCIGY